MGEEESMLPTETGWTAWLYARRVSSRNRYAYVLK